MQLRLTNEQQCRITIAPRTAGGRPARVDGVPVWSTSDPTRLVVAADADEMGALVVTTDLVTDPGTFVQVQVSADADLGPGIRTITEVLDVEVVDAEAAGLGLAVGTPELRP